jgi:hypothetical protein
MASQEVTGKEQVVCFNPILLMQVARQDGHSNSIQQWKDNRMNQQTVTLAVAAAIIGSVAVGSVPPSSAAPVSSSVAALKQSTISDVTDVRYRRYYGHRYYNPGAAIGLGILGAAAGAAAVGSGYYGPGYGYHGPAYGPSYGYYGNPYRRGYYYPYWGHVDQTQRLANGSERRDQDYDKRSCQMALKKEGGATALFFLLSLALAFDDVDDFVGLRTNNDVSTMHQDKVVTAPFRIDFDDPSR